MTNTVKLPPRVTRWIEQAKEAGLMVTLDAEFARVTCVVIQRQPVAERNALDSYLNGQRIWITVCGGSVSASAYQMITSDKYTIKQGSVSRSIQALAEDR